MKELIKLLFEEYGFSRKWEKDVVEFYLNEKQELASFFLINYVDGTEEGDNAETIMQKLKELENAYIDEEDGKSIKRNIQKVFKNENEAAQIDKNTSAIFPILLKDLNQLDEYRNLIYSIEESPYYFRRFVIPYTSTQISELMKIVNDNKDMHISEVMSDLADNEEAYYDLAGHRNLNNVYELVIRIFSKIPFLQYRFKVEQKPLSIEDRVKIMLDDELISYHEMAQRSENNIEQILEASDYQYTDDSIEEEIQQMLRGGE